MIIDIHGLVQDCSTSSAFAMELLQSCTELRNINDDKTSLSTFINDKQQIWKQITPISMLHVFFKKLQ